MSKQDEFFGKATKDCAEIADQYRKLMKEERELLSDLKKLQNKKQMLVKRSKQLRDDQVIKLNLDLQKEKAIRGDLEKKLSALEKKLNQLEKEVDARNREKHLPLTKSSDSTKKVSNPEVKQSVSVSVETKKSNVGAKLKWSKEDPEKGKSSKEAPKSLAASSNVAIQSNSQTNAQSTNQVSGQLSSGERAASQSEIRAAVGAAVGAAVSAAVAQSMPKRTTVQSKTDIQLSKKTATGLPELLPKTAFSIGSLLPKTTGHTETNTEPIEAITAGLPKEQQQIRHSVKTVIQDLIARQNNPTDQSSTPSSLPKALAEPASNVQPLSDSSTNVNYSPSSSNNSDIW